MVQYRHVILKSQRAFTLVEMLVALAILAFIALAVTQMVGGTQKLWTNTTAKISSFQGARAGFQLLTSELQQATVNTYLDYFNASGQTLGQYTTIFTAGNGNANRNAFQAVAYGRQSELHFISGPATTLIPPSVLSPAVTETHAVFFQCPQGVNMNLNSAQSLSALNKLLNAEGFFVEFGTQNTSANSPPAILLPPDKYRYRLMQFVQPTETLSVYNYPGTTANPTNPNDWFITPLTTSHSTTVRMVADNVIALILWPKSTDSPTDTLTANTYNYDSRFGGNPWIPPGGTATPTTDPSTGLHQQPQQMNQMPPLIRVAMVALDEPSAVVLQGNTTTEPIAIRNALTSNSNPDNPGVQIFTVPQFMDSDLNYLQTELSAIVPKIRFQVYSTTVAVRSAKFSTN